MRRILIALGFLTILPVRVRHLTYFDLKGSMVFFPLIGLFLGGILVLLNYGISLLFPPLVTNLLIVATLVILTGALHIDGLADTLDGLYGGKTKKEILEIMRDPKVGLIGVIGVILLLLGKWAILCEMQPAIKDITLLLSPTLGRWSMVLASSITPYAREEAGLGEPFIGKINPFVLLISSLFTLIVSAVFLGINGVLLFILILLIVIILVRFMKKKIGGMTGDTLGSVCEIVEVVVLFVLILY